jgi:hypothetical protein
MSTPADPGRRISLQPFLRSETTVGADGNLTTTEMGETMVLVKQ